MTPDTDTLYHPPTYWRDGDAVRLDWRGDFDAITTSGERCRAYKLNGHLEPAELAVSLKMAGAHGKVCVPIEQVCNLTHAYAPLEDDQGNQYGGITFVGLAHLLSDTDDSPRLWLAADCDFDPVITARDAEIAQERAEEMRGGA